MADVTIKVVLEEAGSVGAPPQLTVPITILPNFGLGAGPPPAPAGPAVAALPQQYVPAVSDPSVGQQLSAETLAALAKFSPQAAANAQARAAPPPGRAARAAAGPVAALRLPRFLPGGSRRVPRRIAGPRRAGLPAEYALGTVRPVRSPSGPPPIPSPYSVGEQIDRDAAKERGAATARRDGVPPGGDDEGGRRHAGRRRHRRGRRGALPYIAIAQAAGQAVAGGLNAARGGVETAGHVTADLARNDFMGAFTKSVDAAGDTLKKIPVVGEPAAAALGLVVQPIKSFGEVVNAFVERGREIGKYSGPLATANAMADVRSLLGDIREAQTVGPEQARLTDASSKIWDDIRRDFEPVKKVVIGALADFLQWLEPIVREQLPEAIAGIAKALDKLVDVVDDYTNNTWQKNSIRSTRNCATSST